jgi:hypothetical protein
MIKINRIVLTAALAAAIAGAQPVPPKTQRVRAKQTDKQVALWRRIMRYTGISATPAGLRGDDQADPEPGDIWVTGLSAVDTSRKLTGDGGYRSPIFGDGGKSILALRGAELVEISVSDSATRRLTAPPNLSKLVAWRGEPESKVLALTTDDRIGLFAPASTDMEFLIVDAESAGDLEFLQRLKSWTRVSNGWSLYAKPVGTSVRTGWTDIFIRQDPAGPRAISDCKGAYCSQPSLSEDRRQVVFIRTEKNRKN